MEQSDDGDDAFDDAGGEPRRNVMTRRRLLRAALAAAGILAVLLVAALLLPNQVLCVENGPQKADVIVVLGGGSFERPLRAAELFHENAASKIILTGAGDNDGNRRLLIKKDVPSSAIMQETESKTTRENALFTIPLLRKEGARQVILVTSWYHSRRALHCFRHYAPDIQFYSRPAYYAYRRAEWTPQGIRGKIRAEYVKMVGYWFCYGVSPL